MVETRSSAAANRRRRQDNNNNNNNRKKKRFSASPPLRRQPKRRCKAVQSSSSLNNRSSNNNRSSSSGCSSNILNLLDADSLLQVLLRTCPEDHNALWYTCREFRRILDGNDSNNNNDNNSSPLFAQQRAVTEWAVVQARPWTGRELFQYNRNNGIGSYDNDDDNNSSSVDSDDRTLNYVRAVLHGEYSSAGYTETPGAVSNKFSITVDGTTVGQGSYVLVDRSSSNNSRRRNFHALCDGVSQELHQVACLFFNRRGGFRIRQVQQAAAEEEQQQQGGSSNNRKKKLLYVSRLKLHPLYRGEAYTWIGATAIRSLLQHETLRDEWGIVIYIGDSQAQFVAADKAQHNLMITAPLAPSSWMDFLATIRGERQQQQQQQDTATTKQEKKQWQARLDALAQQDLKQFLRAGFVQTAETVLSTPLLHVFMLPHFLQDNKPMLSAEETAQLTIVQKSHFSLGTAPVTEQDANLLQYMVKACGQRKRLQERWESLSQDAPASTDQARLFLDQGFQSMVEDQVTNAIHELDESLQEQEDYFQMLRTNLEYMRQELATSSTVFEGMQTPTYSAVPNSNIRRLERNLQSLQGSIQDLEAEVAAKEAILTQARRRRAELNVDDMLLRVWNEYRSQRDEMAESMFATARETVAQALEDVQKHDQTVRTELTQRVEQGGASVASSNSLHACAANLLPEYMDLMLEFLPKSEHCDPLNKRDQNGTTPLMAAAATEASEKQEKVRYKTLEKLIDLGVDKSITNGWGETALGELRKNKRSRDDYRFAFQLGSRPDDDDDDDDTAMQTLYSSMEQLLRPFGGPTPADDAILEDVSSEVDRHVVPAVFRDHDEDSEAEEEDGDEDLLWVF